MHSGEFLLSHARARAFDEWLTLTFPEHRQASNINVTATASAQQAAVVVTEEQRQRRRILGPKGRARAWNGSMRPYSHS